MKILVIPWAEINSLWLSPSVSHLIFQNQIPEHIWRKQIIFSQKEFQSVYRIFLLFCFVWFEEMWKLPNGYIFHCEPLSRTETAVLHNTKLPLIPPWSVRGSFGWGMNSELCPQALLNPCLELQCNCNRL